MKNFQPYCVYLKCSFAATSDFAHIWIGFRSTRYGFSIWAGDDKVRLRVAAINSQYSWRLAAISLLDLEQAHADGETLYDIIVTGESGWRAELLALCWVQHDQISTEIKRFLLGLDDNTLERLANNLGSLTSKNSLDLLLRYIELESINPLECWSKTFPENPKFYLNKLVSHLEKKAKEKYKLSENARNVALAAFRAAIDKIIQDNRTAWQSYGLMGAWATNTRRNTLKLRLEEFVISNSRLPNDTEILQIMEHLFEHTQPQNNDCRDPSNRGCTSP